MMNKINFRDIVFLVSVSLLLIVIQTTFVPLLAVSSIVPDILLIWVVYISLVYGQIPATILGFSVGLLDDILSSGVIGLTAFIKTLVGFLAGYFFNENKRNYATGELLFLLILFFSSLAHNVINIFFIIQGAEMTFWSAMIRSGLFSTVYTLIIALLPFFYFRKRIQT